MENRLFRTLASLSVVGALTCAGCGPGQTTVDPGRARSPQQTQQQMEKREAALMGEKPADLGKPPAGAAGAEKAGAAKAAEEKPAGKDEAPKAK